MEVKISLKYSSYERRCGVDSNSATLHFLIFARVLLFPSRIPRPFFFAFRASGTQYRSSVRMKADTHTHTYTGTYKYVIRSQSRRKFICISVHQHHFVYRGRHRCCQHRWHRRRHRRQCDAGHRSISKCAQMFTGTNKKKMPCLYTYTHSIV